MHGKVKNCLLASSIETTTLQLSFKSIATVYCGSPKIDPNIIIDEKFVESLESDRQRGDLHKNSTLLVYVDQLGIGSKALGEAERMNRFRINFIKTSIRKLDKILDIGFAFIDSKDQANIKIAQYSRHLSNQHYNRQVWR